MLTTLRKAEYAELMILFFIQASGMAIWFVPLGPILDAHGLHHIKPFAFAARQSVTRLAVTHLWLDRGRPAGQCLQPGYLGAGIWLLVVLFTCFLPVLEVPNPPSI